MEGLVDCGRIELAKEAMSNFAQYQKSNGGICALNNVQWECTTAMFQFAITWYKLGEKEKADLTYTHVCSLQNRSGGWYGCKRDGIIDYIRGFFSRSYFQFDEISWAVKFCIDATYFKQKSEGIIK